jgi:uncharacterized protein (DUF1800 family)
VADFAKEHIDFSKIEKARMARETILEGLEPYTGPFELAQKKHLLNRSLIGLSSAHMKEIANLSLSKALDLIFTEEKFPPYPINDYYYEITKEETEKQGHFHVPPGEPFHEAPEPNGSPWPRHQSFEAWMFKYMVEQKTSIHWKMLFFLHNLVPAASGSVKMFYQYYETIYKNCFKSYKDFIYQITLDPLMLDYLNLQSSNKSKPDENYARELQELFTVGKGPNSKYTENDVVEMARTLVGWRYDYESKNKQGRIRTDFNMWNHDYENKQFSAFYGNKKLIGKPGYEGNTELNDLLDMIFATEECGLYISRRLYQFFCSPIIDDTTEKNIIQPMAELFRKNNFSLIAPLKALMGSAHFFNSQNYNAMIKSPMEFTMGFYKEFEYKYINYETPTDLPAKYVSEITKDFYKYRNISWNMSNIGINFTNPPNVAGWPAYYQYPVYDLFWINSDTLAKRAGFANGTARWGFYLGTGNVKGNVHVQIDWVAYISKFKKPSDIDALLAEIEERLLGAPLSDTTKFRLKYTTLGGMPATYYTELYNAFINNPSDANRNTLRSRLENLFASVFQLNEYHLF